MTSNSATQSEAALNFARISAFDWSTNPPVGIPAFAAVKSVSDRCRIARVNRYGVSGAYAAQIGQNSQWKNFLISVWEAATWRNAAAVSLQRKRRSTATIPD